MFQIFCGSHPCSKPGSLSRYHSTVSALTSPASPEMTFAFIVFPVLKWSYFAPLNLFMLLEQIASKFCRISSFFFKIVWIWVLPHLNFSASFHVFSCGLAWLNWITSKRVFISSSSRLRLLETDTAYIYIYIYNYSCFQSSKWIGLNVTVNLYNQI